MDALPFQIPYLFIRHQIQLPELPILMLVLFLNRSILPIAVIIFLEMVAFGYGVLEMELLHLMRILPIPMLYLELIMFACTLLQILVARISFVILLKSFQINLHCQTY